MEESFRSGIICILFAGHRICPYWNSCHTHRSSSRWNIIIFIDMGIHSVATNSSKNHPKQFSCSCEVNCKKLIFLSYSMKKKHRKPKLYINFLDIGKLWRNCGSTFKKCEGFQTAAPLCGRSYEILQLIRIQIMTFFFFG